MRPSGVAIGHFEYDSDRNRVRWDLVKLLVLESKNYWVSNSGKLRGVLRAKATAFSRL
jgi:hypothetical protein